MTSPTVPAIEESLEEELISFTVGDLPMPLYGVLHHPALRTGARRSLGVILLGGWAGTRVGAHGILVAMARDLARHGIYALRFDYRGRGDSEGELRAAHIGTMVADARAAAAFMQSHAGVRKLFLSGICAGAMVAMAASPGMPGLAGLALWSPEPFHPDPLPGGGAALPGALESAVDPRPGSQGVNRARLSQKRRSFLKTYWAKLFDPRSWAKLRHGKLQPRLIIRILLGKPVGKKPGGPPNEGKAAANWAGPKPDERAYELAFPRVDVPAFFIYGTNDPEQESAIAYYRKLRATCVDSTSFHLVEGANHSFYSLVWKEEVIRETRDWILTTCAASST